MNSEWFQRLIEIESPDATTRTLDFPLVLERGEGSYVWDVEGNRYIDMIAGFGSLPLGHDTKLLQKSISGTQLIQGFGDVYPTSFKIQFIEQLLSFLPPRYNRAALAVTGSQAVELAMKTAMLYTGGSGFISFQASYHGLDLGVLPLVGNDYFRKPFSSWVKSQTVERLPYHCNIELLEKALCQFQEKGIKPAAVIVEPVLGRGGFVPASLEWLNDVKRVSEKNNCLLIFDEVFTGFGRAGSATFAELVPCDLICFGKAIGGGMPLSACVSSQQIMSAWPENYGEAIHTGTFFGHALSCRVGFETLKTIEELDLVKRSSELGKGFLENLRASLSKFSAIKEIRGRGLMIAVEFHDAKISLKTMERLRAKGVLVIPCGVQGECVSLTPALNVQRDVLKIVLEKLTEILADLHQ